MTYLFLIILRKYCDYISKLSTSGKNEGKKIKKYDDFGGNVF